MKALFPYRTATGAARVRVVCLPHAGGGAALYRDWSIEGVDICAVELAGRGRRFGDAPHVEVDAVVDEVTEALAALPDLPLVLFGQSLGARLAFALALRVPPLAIVVAAAGAPSRAPRRGMADLPRDALVQKLGEIGGTPREVLENDEMMDLFLPMLRADLHLAEWTSTAAVRCPIVALRGDRDEGVSRADVEAWREHGAAFSYRELAGGHFFVQSARADVVEIVAEVTRNGLGP